MANGKAQAIKAEDQEWADFKKQITEIIRLLGSLLFTPGFILIGICYGLRAGLIVGTEKTLELFKSWGE